MFIELAGLVQEQGEMLDNIQANVEAAELDVEKGKKHLSDAEKSKNSARKKKIICFILLGLVLLITVLVILSEFGLFEGGSSAPKVIYQTIPTTTSTTTTTTPKPLTTEAP